jgi:hypothetical protein
MEQVSLSPYLFLMPKQPVLTICLDLQYLLSPYNIHLNYKLLFDMPRRLSRRSFSPETIFPFISLLVGMLIIFRNHIIPIAVIEESLQNVKQADFWSFAAPNNIVEHPNKLRVIDCIMYNGEIDIWY